MRRKQSGPMVTAREVMAWAREKVDALPTFPSTEDLARVVALAYLKGASDALQNAATGLKKRGKK